MHTTHHCKARQSQRGIPLKLIDYVLSHGSLEKDKFVLGLKEAKQRLADLEREKRLLMKIADKGGVVVVAEGETLITTYNCTHRN
ncbi:DUF4258 domain-containing protein [Pseudomonas sp. PDM30]|uniref:DUF4258 domain-containing protein n=1 Tax=Pseudomonas sp. PDM30 TaxID=2854773 RepID=UPI001C48B774|nr:DUF4258 domain-containing protein [Pseudomonas sp. PDM30]MBV7488035.1 DUF4258 domain-containing protein [Pseudomonas sp. PDM30]